MLDRFASYAQNLVSPPADGFAITPSDDDDLAQLTRAIYVGEGGDLAAILQSGAEVIFKAVPTGTLLPLRARRIKLASTAGFLVGLC